MMKTTRGTVHCDTYSIAVQFIPLIRGEEKRGKESHECIAVDAITSHHVTSHYKAELSSFMSSYYLNHNEKKMNEMKTVIK